MAPTDKKDSDKNGSVTEEEMTETNPAENNSADEDAPLKTTPKKKGRPSKGSAKSQAKKKGKKGKKGAGKKAEDTDETKEGDTGGDTTEDDQKDEEKKKKPIKKVIPYWATISDQAGSKKTQVGPSGLSGGGTIIEAIKECADAKGLASYILIKKYVQKNHPAWPKMVFKSALRRSVQKGQVKQVRNSYKVLSEKIESDKKSKKSSSLACSLEELFPHIFTWVCEPKEASYGLIRKYIGKYFPNLSTEGNLKKAIENMEAKGQLDRITGKGASGTLQLVDGASKTGTAYEDPVEDAIIASNEPKDASVQALRHYLSEYHTEYNVANNPKVLKKALDRAEAMGWIMRVTGQGFTGTFRLSYPYIPSPKDLWRGDYNKSDYEAKPKKSSKYYDSTDEEDETESEDEDDEESSSDSDAGWGGSDVEVVPKKKKRGAPKERGAVPAPKKRKSNASESTKKPKAKSKKSSSKKGKK